MTPQPCRCRIVVQKGTWLCQTLGCKKKGTVVPHQLVDDEGHWISRKDAPGPHPFMPGETCLFDRPPPLKHERDRKQRTPAPVEHSLIRVEVKPDGQTSRTWLSDWPSFSEAREEAKKLKDPRIEIVPASKWHNGEG